MKEKLALKKLTASDLTFFEWHFKNKNAGNQKAINLNANIFIKELYPLIPELSVEKGGKIPIDLTIYGPSFDNVLSLQRKIVKFGAYKNWRLNGEFVYNPENDPERYNALLPGDYVLFDFRGLEMPHSLKLHLISSNLSPAIHSELSNVVGASKMMSLTKKDIEKITDKVKITPDHHLYNLIIDNILEEIVHSGSNDLENRKKFTTNIKASQEDLNIAKRKAELIGRKGEEIVNHYLNILKEHKDLNDLDWTANINAISPFDFEIVEVKERILVDVKSTSNDFSNVIYISLNELKCMAYSENRYDLYRVYEITETSAKVRIANDLKNFALSILHTLYDLPEGINSNGISLKPDLLPFEEEIDLSLE